MILNKVASDRHEALLREALDSAGVPVLGVLRRAPQVETPSRHLGLVPVAERRAAAVEAVAAMGAQVAAGCDLEGLVALARSAGALSCVGWDAGEALTSSPSPPLPVPSLEAARPESKVRVAVAGGPAFTFSYAEHTELLAAAGAEVVVFDPLRDEQLPEGTRGLVIGGGFPEVYAAELSANEPLRKAVAGLAESGAPVAAECAGLLYLCRELDGMPMCGVLDASGGMSGRLTLGYRDAVALSDSVLAVAGTRMRGHEFHRTVVEPGSGAAPAWGFAPLSGGSKVSYNRVCTRVICTRTGRPSPVWPVGSWRGAGRHEQQQVDRSRGGSRRSELVTVKGVNALREADVIVVPVMDTLERGRAEATVLHYVPAEKVLRVVFALNERTDRARREAAWDAAGAKVAELLGTNGVVAFATIGDPNVYSTFTYLALTIGELVPGSSSRPCPGSPPCRISRRAPGPYSPKGPSR